jgi:hypothetical protein
MSAENAAKIAEQGDNRRDETIDSGNWICAMHSLAAP